MNTEKSALAKYLCLLALVSLTVLQLIFDWFTSSGLIFIQICLGILHLIFTYLEIASQANSNENNLERFFYYTNGMFAKKAIWVGALLIAGFVLLNSESSIHNLTPIVWFLVLSEVFSLVWRFKKKAYYISIYANYLSIVQTDVRKIFAANIASIEFRYDIFYLTLKNNQVEMLELECFLPEKRDLFKKEFLDWGKRNQLSFSNEAKKMLNII